MEKYTQQEKDFRLELSNLLLKHNATISIEDTEEIDYNNVPGLGNIYKKSIEVSVRIDGESVYCNDISFHLGNDVKHDNIFSCHAKTVLPELKNKLL